jgi:cytochrome c553
MAALMVGMALSLSEEDIQKLAEYLSTNTGAN